MYRLSWLHRIFGIVPCKTGAVKGHGREGALQRGFVAGLRHGVREGATVAGDD